MAKQKTRTTGKKSVNQSGLSVYYIREHDSDPLFMPHIEFKPSPLAEGGTKPSPSFSDLLESICGNVDDSQPVEQYDGTLGVTAAFVTAHQGAVCQVQWNSNLSSVYAQPGNVSGVRWGTGTMITDDLMLTCGHLFDQSGGGWQRPRVNGTANIISPQEIARNMHVNFNFQVDSNGVQRQEQSFPITELLEYRLGDVDMAICRIGGSPGATFGKTRISTKDASVPDMLCIIGHPAGMPKMIEAGPATSIDGNFIRYGDIDTQGGNSGSGILHASSGLLVGIHTNGGCGPNSPAGGGTNFGQRIEAVVRVSPILKRLNLTKLPFKDIGTDPIADSKLLLKEPITDPITRKELSKDGLKDGLKDGIKDGPKDGIKDPIKDGGKDGIFDPGGTLIESSTGGDPRVSPIGPISINNQILPFVMASPSRAAEGMGGVNASQNNALSQISAIEQALQELDKQRAELVQAYYALAQNAGLV